MWIAGAGVVNQPSDPEGPRAVVGALLIYAAPLEPAPAHELPANEAPVEAAAKPSGCRAEPTASSLLWLVVLVAVRGRRSGCNR